MDYHSESNDRRAGFLGFRRHPLSRSLLAAGIGWAFCLTLWAGGPPIAGNGGNNPPHAIIKPVPKIGKHHDALAVPTLDGTQSFDPDFDFITYQWKDSSGMIIGNGPTVQVVLVSFGTYTYVLIVCDTHYSSQDINQTNPLHSCASASIAVEVVEDDLPPSVDAPDITVSVTDPGSATVSKSTALSNYMLNGATTSAVDDIDPHPQFQRVVGPNGTVTPSTVFPEGDTPILVFYVDQAFNVGSSPATVHVTDRQDNDIFLLTGEGNCFAVPCNDVIQRVRGGVVEDFCTFAGGTSPTQGLIVDSSGRLVALRDAVNIAGVAGLEMVRCNTKGAPLEKFAWFQRVGGVPPGYREPFPNLVVGPNGGGGLTLGRLNEVVIDDNQNKGQPFFVNEDVYIFNLQLSSDNPGSNPNKSVMYHVKQDFWEDGPDLGSNISTNLPASMYFDSGTTFVTGGNSGCLGRVKIPLSIHAMGQLGGVDFDLRLNLFSQSGEFCGYVVNDRTLPPSPPECPPPMYSAPYTNPRPSGGGMGGFMQVFYDEFSGHGLTLSGNYAPAGGIDTLFSTLPLDDPSNDDNYWGNGLAGCALQKKVDYTPLKPGGVFAYGPITPTSQGLLMMTSTFPTCCSLVEMTSDKPRFIVRDGLGPAGPIAAWPINVSAGFAATILIRVDSPVDMLITDPTGKRLGVISGASVNDFGKDGADTGAGSHPRFYAISKPVPGDYSVRSVGTDSGPYTVHVYSVDTSKPFGQHIFNSGMASPGSLSSQNFTLDTDGGIAFTNHPPLANPGPDQTVTAGANGMAMVNLDGSASSDPDGDTLSFSWAGPFGLVSGAQSQVALPAGISVLELTVSDGRGGSSAGNLTITVNAAGDTTPPVVTPPANISIPATEAAGARGNDSVALTSFLAAGSAVDDTDPSPTRLVAQVAGMDVDSSTLFPLGTTPVTFRFQDASGNIGSAVASVTVSLGSPRLAGAVVGKGRDASGNYFVDLRMTDTGTGNARSVQINQLAFRTLSGTGTVSLNATLSGALPLAVGSIDAGASETVRLYLNLPPTVTRFSITETGSLQDVAGASFSYSQAQAVIP